MVFSFRHYYWRWLKNLILLCIFVVCAMTIARLSFSVVFGELSNYVNYPRDMVKAFILGLRYDLMPIAYINILPFLILNLGVFFRGARSIIVIRFLIISILFIGHVSLVWLYIFDYGFYSYFQDHLNILVFGFIEDDTKSLVISIYKNYNLFLWLGIVFVFHYLLFKLIKLFFSPFDFDLKNRSLNFKNALTFFLGMVVLTFMARGTFSRLPLSIEDAHFSSNEFINKVSLNGALALNRAIKIRKTFGKDQFDYLRSYGFKDWKDAYEAYFTSKPQASTILKSLTAQTKKNEFLKTHPPHVIMVVMESFGSYWNKSDNENFQILGDLKKHFRDGYLFENFLPSENGTIGSIVAIATSQVTRPGSRYLSESEYLGTTLASSGHLPFKASGYESHFVYGGKLGWRDLGKYLRVQKYDHLWGADEIKERIPELNNFAASDLGNEWGIFDEYLYNFIEEHLKIVTKPQFFLVLTTSNHPPFEYPSTYEPRPLIFTKEMTSQLTITKNLAQKRFLGFQYSNQKMGEFLSRVKEADFGQKTIVALTGDHSFWVAKGVGIEEEFKRYAVPFFLSIPEKYQPLSFDNKKFGSHEDIFPTLINLSLSDQSYIKLGEDLFSDDTTAMNSTGIIANKDGAYHNNRYWKWKNLDDLTMTPVHGDHKLEALRKKSLGLIGLTDSYLKFEKNDKPHGEKNGQQ